MAKQILKLSVGQLIIHNEEVFDISSFSSIVNDSVETAQINIKPGERETLSVKQINKQIHEDRFISIYFKQGDKFPYPETVVGSDLDEHKNPRSPEEIELSEQFFVLIDIVSQRIYLSDQRKKTTLAQWLGDKLDREITIKSVIAEQEFISRLRTVDKIGFSVVPNLFNRSDNSELLSDHLVQDIFGFDAEKAYLEFHYNQSKVTEKIKAKFNELMRRKSEVDDIVVIGRNEESLESVFNLNEVTNKITIEVNVSDRSQLLDPKEVFYTLIGKIKLL